MAIGDFFNKLMGIDGEEEPITEEDVQGVLKEMKKGESNVSSFQPKPSLTPEKRFSINGTGTFKLVVIEPKSFDECPKLVDSLKGRRPVIINLEKVETETAKKIFDFLSGATYALDGNVQKIANNIFIFAPASVDIAANHEDKGFSFTNKGTWK